MFLSSATHVFFRNVSNGTLAKGNINGMWKLTLLTSGVQIVPILFLCLLPQSKQEQEELGKNKEKSVIGGLCFLGILFGSLIWTIVTALSKLIDPSDIDDDYY